MANVAITIAGSDSSSGAGIQADLKTFSTLGIHGLTAVTSVVAESPHSVDSIFPLPPEEVIKQIQSVIAHYPIGAIKTGLLYSPEIIEAVATTIEQTELKGKILVIDPVLGASTGDSLTSQSIVDIYKKYLFSKATIITPNIPEAEAILGSPLTSEKDIIEAAKAIAKEFNTACLLKGGHATYTEMSVDYLATPTNFYKYEKPWIDIPMSHGTGCTLSAAITANLCKGQALPTAVNNAKTWLHTGLERSLIWQKNGVSTFCINQAEI